MTATAKSTGRRVKAAWRATSTEGVSLKAWARRFGGPDAAAWLKRKASRR